ncbi:MAG: hypothetical protein U0K91_02370 [Acutalibacteraceae bacterium]|nr:hypothetical protein [Acutalibacteraceae bacterium]
MAKNYGTDLTRELGAECRRARLENNMRLVDVQKELSENGIAIGISSLQRMEKGEQSLDFQVAMYYRKLGAQLDFCF